MQDALQHEMRKGPNFLRQLRAAREAVKNLLDGPDADIDRIIRSVREHGTVSNKLMSEFSMLADEVLAGQVVEVIASAFE